jgi:hypothetical protein
METEYKLMKPYYKRKQRENEHGQNNDYENFQELRHRHQDKSYQYNSQKRTNVIIYLFGKENKFR